MRKHIISMVITLTFLSAPALVAVAADCWVTLDNGTQLLDSDCDGIFNKVDKCPLPDKKNADGLGMDTDGDGLWDACDKCPMVPAPKDATGKPLVVDQDNDGIPNECDNCPTAANGNQLDSDQDGVGDACQCAPDEESNAFTPGAKDVCNGMVLSEYFCDKGKSSGTLTIDCAKYTNTYQAGVCENNACALKPVAGQPPPTGDGKIGDDGDYDKDGIKNKDDNCPFTPNPDQADSNGNGVGDACEKNSKSGSMPGGSSKDGSPAGVTCKPLEEKTTSIVLKGMSTLNLHAVAASGVDRQWVAGEGGNILTRVQGGTWTKMQSPWDAVPNIAPFYVQSYGISALWSPEKDVLLAGTLHGSLFIYKGGQWQLFADFGKSIYAIHGTTADDFWVAGRDGLLMHYVAHEGWKSADQDNPIWTARAMEPQSWWRGAVRNYYFESLYANETTWRSLYVVPGKFMIASGDGGRVIKKFDASNWDIVVGFYIGAWLDISPESLTQLPVPPSVRAVWASPDVIYAAGAAGTVLAKIGDQDWVPALTVDPKITLLGIAGSSVSNLLLVGTHGMVLHKTGADLLQGWAAKAIPIYNSVTAVWANPNFAVATGINGQIYDYTVSSGAVKATSVLTNQLSHPERTHTRWSAVRGSIDKSGAISGMLTLVGDDLSVATVTSAYSWELKHSDAAHVPFTQYDGSSFRDLRDMLMIGDDLYAVGSASVIVAREAGTWSLILIGDAAGQIPDDAKMQSIRQGPNGSILIAGTAGVFQWMPAAQMTKIFITNGVSRAVAMKMLTSNRIAVAYDDAMHIVTPASTYMSSEGPWGLPDPFDAEDMAMMGSTTAVIGNDKPAGWGWGAAQPKPHLFMNAGGQWVDETKYLSSTTAGFLRLKPFKESFKSLPIVMEGFAVLGEADLAAVTTQTTTYLLSPNANSGTTVEDWYDGVHSLYDTMVFGLTEATQKVDVYLLGVGGHNAFERHEYHMSCTVPYGEVVNFLSKFL